MGTSMSENFRPAHRAVRHGRDIVPPISTLRSEPFLSLPERTALSPACQIVMRSNGCPAEATRIAELRGHRRQADRVKHLALASHALRYRPLHPTSPALPLTFSATRWPTWLAFGPSLRSKSEAVANRQQMTAPEPDLRCMAAQCDRVFAHDIEFAHDLTCIRRSSC
jgi:hypothetical protein